VVAQPRFEPFNCRLQGVKTYYLITFIDVKVKVTLEQATKAQRGSRVIALNFI